MRPARLAIAAVTALAVLSSNSAAAQVVQSAPSAKVTSEQQRAIDAYAAELKRFLAAQDRPWSPSSLRPPRSNGS